MKTFDHTYEKSYLKGLVKQRNKCFTLQSTVGTTCATHEAESFLRSHLSLSCSTIPLAFCGNRRFIVFTGSYWFPILRQMNSVHVPPPYFNIIFPPTSYHPSGLFHMDFPTKSPVFIFVLYALPMSSFT